MIPFVAALAFQAMSKPIWAVAEFRDLKQERSGFGRIAAADCASELEKDGRYQALSGNVITRSAMLGGAPLTDRIDDLGRITRDLRAGAFVTGEVIDYRIVKVKGRREGQVALRVLVYDAILGQPVSGAIEKGESALAARRVGDAALISEALEQAAEIAGRTLQGQTLPAGTIVACGAGHPTIDQGARAGFRSGDRVTVARGATLIEYGHIARCDPDRAEATLEGAFTSFAPGDRVRALYVPPPFPPKGTSVFTETSDRPPHHRRPWWRWW